VKKTTGYVSQANLHLQAPHPQHCYSVYFPSCLIKNSYNLKLGLHCYFYPIFWTMHNEVIASPLVFGTEWYEWSFINFACWFYKTALTTLLFLQYTVIYTTKQLYYFFLQFMAICSIKLRELYFIDYTCFPCSSFIICSVIVAYRLFKML